MTLLIMFLAGLITGWNFLPQPLWIQAIVLKIKNKFRSS